MSKRVITLGTWDGKPIEWIVLKEEGFACLLLSKVSIGDYCFNRNNSDGNDWDKSFIRAFLNKEFYNKAFSKDDIKRIINTKLEKEEFNPCKDNVFLLSGKEAEIYLTQKERIFNGQWLLRSHWDGGGNSRVLRILSDGRLSLTKNGAISSCDVNYSYPIRPAMWVMEK